MTPFLLVKTPTAEQIADEDATVTLSDTDGNLFRTGVGDTYTSHCYRYFYGDLSSARTSFVFSDYSVSADSQEQVAASSTTESDKLSGVGLQFGYRGKNGELPLPTIQAQEETTSSPIA